MLRYVFMCAALSAGPALAEDPFEADPAQIKAGKRAFLSHCARCHGKVGQGGNGPDIQGSIPKDVLDATQGIDQMPEIPLKPGEAAAIAAYLMALAPDVAEIKQRLEREKSK